MAFETKLVQKLNQSLLMTPQLQQAIKLLTLGRLEYKEAIEREMLENPVLEEVKEDFDGGSSLDTSPEPTEPMILSPNSSDSNDGETPSEAKADWDNFADIFSDYGGSASAKGQQDSSDRQTPEVVSTPSESLEDHLLDQVRLGDYDEEERQLAQHIIGNLDRNGFLSSSLEEVAAAAGCDVSDVETMIDRLRFLDPIGVCSYTLQQCLLTQLESMGLGESLESRIVALHLDKLERRKYEVIAKAESVTAEAVSRAAQTIRSLEPRPGRAFSDETTRYIMPDVYVQKVAGEYVVTLNEDGLPRLRVSPLYMDMLREKSSQDAEQKAYLNEKLRSASWLIKSIHQRQQTIFRVTESIVKFQKDFLDHGIQHLRPLVLKDVAEDIGMHESTVSRVTTEKYVHTSQGVFELKFFFTSGIKTSEGDISSSSVKERIKHIVAGEPSEDPISDQQIVEMLKGEKITIARRTVAKYRESLGIPGSSQRKKHF